MPSDASKQGLVGVSHGQNVRLLDSLTVTSSVPLVLSCSVAVVLVSSLEIKWKNLIHQSGSDFTVIFSRFLVSVSKLDFQRSSRNLVSPWFFHQKWFSVRFFCIFPEYSRVQQLPSSRAPTGCQKSLYGCPKVENGLFFHRLRNSKNPLFWGTWWYFWALLHQLMNHSFHFFWLDNVLCHPSEVPCEKKSWRTSFGEVLGILRKIEPTIQGFLFNDG